MKVRIPFRWTVNRYEGDIVFNTVYRTKRAALRVANKAREAGHRTVVLHDGVAIA